MPIPIAPGCCHGGHDDGGQDHPVSDGVIFFGLILLVVLASVTWRLLSRRFTRARIDARDGAAECTDPGEATDH